MSKNKLFFCIIITLFQFPKYEIFGQEPYCENLNFELGNFTNWTGYTWIYSTVHNYANTQPRAGIVDRRHTIITDTEAYDPNTGNQLKLVPPGHSYSIRLGDAIYEPWRPGLYRCWNQSLRYNIDVDINNSLLIIKFALVLEYDADHLNFEEPRFKFTLYDNSNNVIDDCANYDVYASNEAVEGFHFYENPAREDIVNWRDWTTVGIDLSSYLGQSVTIEFLANDCTRSYDFGYAYFVATCHPMNIVQNYCEGDQAARLTAPEGFKTYNWSNSSGGFVDSRRNIEIADPPNGEIYTCEMTSETGCVVSLSSTVYKYAPQAEFSSYIVDCNSNTVQLVNNSSTNFGNLEYIWDFGEGVTSTERQPRHIFETNGIHEVSLRIFNPPSVCTKFIQKEVESFSRSLTGIKGDTIFCEDDSLKLTAYGAFEHAWGYVDNTDTIWNDFSQDDTVMYAKDYGGMFVSKGRSKNRVCADTDSKMVYRFAPQPDFSSRMINCDSNTVQITNHSSTNLGQLNYIWDFGEGITSTERDPQYKFETSGIHEISLEILNPPSNCTRLLQKEVESFSPPLIGIRGDSTYCKDDSIPLVAYGTYEYSWGHVVGNDTNWTSFSEDDTFYAKDPGGTYISRGRSRESGCKDTDYKIVTEDPEWGISFTGDSLMCEFDSNLVIVGGSESYIWSTGDSTETIFISAPNSYNVLATNKRGCQKTRTLNTYIVPPPDSVFTISDYIINKRKSDITCTIPAQENVEYTWIIDDGTLLHGPTINHNFNITNYKLFYEISLNTINIYGCKSSSSQFVDVIPFVPNVFSPNDDGINDIFMPGLDLQIFDRYGVILYDGNEGWDGTYKERPVDQDTYFYAIFYRNRENEQHTVKGYLTLVR